MTLEIPTSSNILMIQKNPVYLLSPLQGLRRQGLQSLGPTIRARPGEDTPLTFHIHITGASTPHPFPRVTDVTAGHPCWVGFFLVIRISPGAATPHSKSLQKSLDCSVQGKKCPHRMEHGPGFIKPKLQIQQVSRYHSHESHIYIKMKHHVVFFAWNHLYPIYITPGVPNPWATDLYWSAAC